MIFVFKALLFSIILSSLAGCISFSRLTEPHAAQTLGKGNSEVELSASGISLNENLKSALIPISLSLEYTRGLSDHFDLATFVEGQWGNLLIGLESKYQLAQNGKHAWALLFGTGLSKGKNEYDDPEEYKKVADDLLLGYFSYLGPVYSFKPNNKYELTLNLRINHNYSQSTVGMKASEALGGAVAKAMMTPIVGLLGDHPPVEEPEIKHPAQKESLSLLYGSINMSHTWWIVPSFGATLSLGIMYPFYDLDRDEDSASSIIDGFSYLAKSGLNFHFNF